MNHSPFKFFRRSVASLSLLAATGCASMMATDYRTEYGVLPQTADAGPLSRTEFSGENVADTAQTAAKPATEKATTTTTTAIAEPLVTMTAADETQQPSVNLEEMFGATAAPDAAPVDADVATQNPFALMDEQAWPEAAASPTAPPPAFEPQAFDQAQVAAVSVDEVHNSDLNPFALMESQATTASEGPAIVRISGKKAAKAASTFRAAEPRLPSSHSWSPPAASVTVGATQHPQAYPDEYIFDGGDRDTPVHYFGGVIEGLDTEDTVAEFKDHKGESHVKASNRVAVYAPRFGAVETVTGPDIDVKIDKAAGARDVAGLGTLHDERGMNMNVARTPASGVAVRSSPGGVETAQPAHMGRRAESVLMNSIVEQGFEAKTVRGLGLLEISDVHELNLQILEPAKSNTTTFVGQRAATTQATETYAMFRLASMTGSEEGGAPGEIHITKEASPLIAKSGDIITFKIHFLNTGDHNVSEVRIIDNLTPRLIYVNGTGEVNVPNGGAGDLSVMPNKDGGQLLQFELDQPLKGGQSGTITFQAKVL